jgi:ferredoxin
MKKAVVNPAICIGCGTCVSLAPNSFKMGDDNKAQAIDTSSDTEELVQTAIDSCPVGAISWLE